MKFYCFRICIPFIGLQNAIVKLFKVMRHASVRGASFEIPERDKNFLCAWRALWRTTYLTAIHSYPCTLPLIQLCKYTFTHPQKVRASNAHKHTHTYATLIQLCTLPFIQLCTYTFTYPHSYIRYTHTGAPSRLYSCAPIHSQ